MCAQASVKKKVRVLSIITGYRATTSAWGVESVCVGGGGAGGALHSQASHDGKCVHSIFDRCHHHIFIDNNDHF